ncbi:hypothetical protein FA95DRAFT_1296389 [Auriscalpium vulgare]|uniref:Uncharacterized protein n=1 Tax=Auriscalpium vulgare TaxID=40419 RepID=A0ACB8RS49_9AGAM|nr:hypothetical protein FA95DRAFT_1296389 [Auriscalpium vulgare]
MLSGQTALAGTQASMDALHTSSATVPLSYHLDEESRVGDVDEAINACASSTNVLMLLADEVYQLNQAALEQRAPVRPFQTVPCTPSPRASPAIAGAAAATLRPRTSPSCTRWSPSGARGPDRHQLHGAPAQARPREPPALPEGDGGGAPSQTCSRSVRIECDPPPPNRILRNWSYAVVVDVLRVSDTTWPPPRPRLGLEQQPCACRAQRRQNRVDLTVLQYHNSTVFPGLNADGFAFQTVTAPNSWAMPSYPHRQQPYSHNTATTSRASSACIVGLQQPPHRGHYCSTSGPLTRHYLHFQVIHERRPDSRAGLLDPYIPQQAHETAERPASWPA